MTILINKTKKSSILKSLIRNGSEFTCDHDIAEICSDYFSNLAVQLDSRLPFDNSDPLSFITGNVSSSIFLSPTSPNECATIIGNLKLTKQSKYKIPVKLFISNREFLSVTVSRMVNQSNFLEKFPGSLKISSHIYIQVPLI